MTKKQKNKNSTICILIGSLEQGGAQSMALRLLDGLERLSIDAHLLALDGNVEVPFHGDPERAEALAARIHVLSAKNSRRSTLAKTLNFPGQWLKLQLKLRQLRCSQLIGFMERANIFVLASCGEYRRVISIRKHLSMAMRDKSKLKRGLIKLAYPLLLKRADAINFNARQSAADFCTLFAAPLKKISVIYNYCDPELLCRQAAEPLQPECNDFFSTPEPVIITSGRLLPVKGHAFLVRAFKRLLDETDIRARLVILGDGPLRNDLQALIDKLDLNDSALMPGYQKNPFAWISKADLFVLPSLAEGFPNSLLEAMAVGRPVVAADCPSGPLELLAEPEHWSRDVQDLTYAEHGVLIPRLDAGPITSDGQTKQPEDILFDAIREMMRNPQLRERYGNMAKNRAAQFSFDRFFNHWQKLLDIRPAPQP